MSINSDLSNYLAVHRSMRTLYKQYGGKSGLRQEKDYDDVVKQTKRNLFEWWISGDRLTNPVMFLGQNCVAFHQMREQLGLNVAERTVNTYRWLANSPRKIHSEFEQIRSALKHRASSLTDDQRKLVAKAYAIFLQNGGSISRRIQQIPASNLRKPVES